MTKELNWHAFSDADIQDFEGYYSKVEGDNGEQIAEYRIGIYRHRGHLYLKHTEKAADGSFHRYGGEYLIECARRWTLDWAKGVADKHFRQHYFK